MSGARGFAGLIKEASKPDFENLPPAPRRRGKGGKGFWLAAISAFLIAGAAWWHWGPGQRRLSDLDLVQPFPNQGRRLAGGELRWCLVMAEALKTRRGQNLDAWELGEYAAAVENYELRCSSAGHGPGEPAETLRAIEPYLPAIAEAARELTADCAQALNLEQIEEAMSLFSSLGYTKGQSVDSRQFANAARAFQRDFQLKPTPGMTLKAFNRLRQVHGDILIWIDTGKTPAWLPKTASGK